jgi:hypothetical protein
MTSHVMISRALCFTIVRNTGGDFHCLDLTDRPPPPTPHFHLCPSVQQGAAHCGFEKTPFQSDHEKGDLEKSPFHGATGKCQQSAAHCAYVPHIAAQNIAAGPKPDELIRLE